MWRWIVATAREAAWAPIAVFTIHTVASLGFGLYSRWPPLDIPMHVAGGVAIAYFLDRAVANAVRFGFGATRHRIVHAVVVLGFVCTAAVLWEFAEFGADQLFAANAQQGLPDTILDMFLGICGGAAFVAGGTMRRGGPLPSPPGA